MWTIYTDGSCLGNPGPGGWAVIVTREKLNAKSEHTSEEGILSGGMTRTTNNVMELTAAIRALQWMWEQNTHTSWQWSETDVQDSFFSSDGVRETGNIDDPIVLITDSNYVKLGITEWMVTRKRRQRRRAKGGKLVEHVSLRKELDALVSCFSHLERQWTKAHVGTPLNERVDTLARKEAQRVC